MYPFGERRNKGLSERRERALVRRASRGDEVAFGRVFEAYVDRVYAFVRSRLDDVHEVEDVTSAVFLKAWEGLPAYVDRGLPFGAWLFRIARNAVTDAYRRSGRLMELSAESFEVEDDDADPHAMAVRAMEAGELRRAMRMLTDEQAAVIVLRFFWELDTRETAIALDRSEGAIKALQHRAVRALARAMGSEGGGLDADA